GLRTTRPESSGSEGRDTTAGMEGQPRKCWASLRSVCRTKVAEESCGHPSCFLGQCDLPGGGRGAMELAGSSALLQRFLCHGSTGRCASSGRDRDRPLPIDSQSSRHRSVAYQVPVTVVNLLHASMVEQQVSKRAPGSLRPLNLFRQNFHETAVIS